MGILQVPIPWLQVKLLRLLQYYPAPGECSTWADFRLNSKVYLHAENNKIKKVLHNCLMTIIQNSQETPKVSRGSPSQSIHITKPIGPIECAT